MTHEELSKTWHSIEQQIHKEIDDNDQKSQVINQSFEAQVPGIEIYSPIGFVESIKNKFENVFLGEKEILLNNENLTAKELVMLAADSISNCKSVFIQEELLKSALKHSIGNYSVSDLKHEMKKFEKEGKLIKHEN